MTGRRYVRTIQTVQVGMDIFWTAAMSVPTISLRRRRRWAVHRTRISRTRKWPQQRTVKPQLPVLQESRPSAHEPRRDCTIKGGHARDAEAIKRCPQVLVSRLPNTDRRVSRLCGGKGQRSTCRFDIRAPSSGTSIGLRSAAATVKNFARKVAVFSGITRLSFIRALAPPRCGAWSRLPGIRRRRSGLGPRARYLRVPRPAAHPCRDQGRR